jgi:hypothetical protein
MAGIHYRLQALIHGRRCGDRAFKSDCVGKELLPQVEGKASSSEVHAPEGVTTGRVLVVNFLPYDLHSDRAQRTGRGVGRQEQQG